MTLMLEAPAELGPPVVKLTFPPAVIHNLHIRPRPHRRTAIECSCQPGVALAVMDHDSYDGTVVLGVHAQHMCAVSVREMQAREAVSQP